MMGLRTIETTLNAEEASLRHVEYLVNQSLKSERTEVNEIEVKSTERETGTNLISGWTDNNSGLFSLFRSITHYSL